MIGSTTRGGAMEASMNRKTSARFLTGAIAAVLFMGAAPEAEARNGMRSARALPTLGAMQSFQAQNTSRAFSPSRSTQAFIAPSFAAPSFAVAPRASVSSLPGLIFGFLPPRLQDVILTRLADRPRGDRLCAILGVPGCVRNDSPG